MAKKTPGEKFNFERLRATATSDDRGVRKESFKKYFQQFEEFPSFLFDNSDHMDERLRLTIQDLKADPDITDGMRRGLATLMARLPEVDEKSAVK